jgi:putative oxidoreductase
MLLPIVFSGPGKISLDHMLSRFLRADTATLPLNDAYAWALAGLALAIPFLLLTPMFGAALLLVAVALFLFGRFVRV